MPGSRDHPDGEINRPAGLGGKLRKELEAALKLLFKTVACHGADLHLESPLTVYTMDIPCELHPVPLASQAPQISADPVSALKQAPRVQGCPLPEAQAVVAAGGACQFSAVARQAPVFEARGVPVGSVRMGGVAARTGRWHAEPIPPRPTGEIPVPRQSAGRVSGLAPGHMQTGVRRVATRLGGQNAQGTGRFHLMALRKSPIPPHRFTPGQRDRFRQALAEKGRTVPANIQLKMVYARLDMTAFSSMQQDEHGTLLCVPKPEAVGRNAGSGRRAPLVYLVFGNRLDNQQSLRALVPIDTPEGPA